VPHAVKAIAQEVIAAALVRPEGVLREYTEATMRLATDPRMRQVWHEVYRHSRGSDRHYLHPACERWVIASPRFSAIRDLAQPGENQERLQEQACVLLFLVDRI
jgi:hypothetical protein